MFQVINLLGYLVLLILSEAPSSNINTIIKYCLYVWIYKQNPGTTNPIKEIDSLIRSNIFPGLCTLHVIAFNFYRS